MCKPYNQATLRATLFKSPADSSALQSSQTTRLIHREKFLEPTWPERRLDLKQLSLSAQLKRVRSLLGFVEPQMTELHNAARNNQVAEMHVLLAKGVDINSRDKHSRTALHLAAFAGKVEAVKALLLAKCNAGASAMDDTNALHFAAQKGHSEICRQLLHAGRPSCYLYELFKLWTGLKPSCLGYAWPPEED